MSKLVHKVEIIAHDLADAGHKPYAQALRDMLDERERVLNTLRELAKCEGDKVFVAGCIGEMLAILEGE